MTIREVLTDDQDGTEIQPGSLHIQGSFRVNFPGGTTQSGDLDFSSFENVVAYVQAQQTAYEATLNSPPPTTVTPVPTP